jgi:hypothetical protein
MKIVNDAISSSITLAIMLLQSSVTLLELSFNLAESIYHKGVTHDDRQVTAHRLSTQVGSSLTRQS